MVPAISPFVANEPSDPAFQALYSSGYDLSFADLSDKVAKIYENSDKSWLPNNGVGLTFADLAAYTILAPSVVQLTAGWSGLSTGAPRELSSNVAYGVNWIFGDTLSNYVSGESGYIAGKCQSCRRTASGNASAGDQWLGRDGPSRLAQEAQGRHAFDGLI